MASQAGQHCTKEVATDKDASCRYVTRNYAKSMEAGKQRGSHGPVLEASADVNASQVKPPGMLTRLQKRKAERLEDGQETWMNKREKFQLPLVSVGRSELTQLLSATTPASLPSLDMGAGNFSNNIYSIGSNASSAASIKKSAVTTRLSGYVPASSSRDVLFSSMTDRMVTCNESLLEPNCGVLASGMSHCGGALSHEKANLMNSPDELLKVHSDLNSAPKDPPSPIQGGPGTEQWYGTYGEDHYLHLLHREELGRKSWSAIKVTQRDIEAHHRKIMVNWLVEFTEEFDLQEETLFLGVTLMDAFLGKASLLKRNLLQLLGMASILLAVKFAETHPPNRMLQKCCEAAEGSFTQEQVKDMESSILKVLSFDISLPSALTFVHHYVKVSESDPRVGKVAEFLVHLALLDAEALKFKHSVVAASAILLSLHTLGYFPWTTSLVNCSGYSALELRECVERLHFLHRQVHCRRSRHTCAVSLKYEKLENKEVALLQATDSLPNCVYYNLRLDGDLTDKC